MAFRTKKRYAQARGRSKLMPLEEDAVNGAHLIHRFATIAAWVGEKEPAQVFAELKY